LGDAELSAGSSPSNGTTAGADRHSDSEAASPLRPPFQLGYRPALDGVRGIAVLVLLLFHVLGPPVWSIAPLAALQGGFLGVDVFFVLSGFLITTILAQEHQTRGTIDLKAFWIRRALRLMPAVLLLLLVLLVLGLLVDVGILDKGQGVLTAPPQHPELPWTALPYWPGIMVILLPLSNFAMLIHQSSFYPLNGAWTLATEDQFYFVWPLVLLFLTIRCRSLKTVALVVSLSVPIFLGWRQFLLHRAGESGIVSPASVMEIYLRPDARVAELLAGCALGLAAVTGMFPTTNIAKRVVTGLAWVGALTILAMFVFAGFNDEWTYRAGFTMVTMATVAVLLHILIAPDAMLSRVLSWPVLVGIGQVSYGIYIWQSAWVIYAPGDGLVHSAAVVALTATSAMLSWVLVEQPALRLKRRFERRADVSAANKGQLDAPTPTRRPVLSRRDLVPLTGTAVMALGIAPLLFVAEPIRAGLVARRLERANADNAAALRAQANADQAAALIERVTRAQTMAVQAQGKAAQAAAALEQVTAVQAADLLERITAAQATAKSASRGKDPERATRDERRSARAGGGTGKRRARVADRRGRARASGPSRE
jgi:peptidoglycan/LPS O-acetylase OafA/YrhL